MQSGNSQAGEGQTEVSVAPKTGQIGNQSQIAVSETRAIDDGERRRMVQTNRRLGKRLPAILSVGRYAAINFN